MHVNLSRCYMNKRYIMCAKGIHCLVLIDTGHFYTRGRTNRLAFVHLMWIYMYAVLLLTCSSRWANRLGKIVFPDGQISDDLLDLSSLHVRWFVCLQETICSSSSVKTATLDRYPRSTSQSVLDWHPDRYTVNTQWTLDWHMNSQSIVSWVFEPTYKN